MPHEYRDANEIINRLRKKRGKIEAWFARRQDSLEQIVHESVGSNTFRAFQNMPKRPSDVFREWAKRELDVCKRTKQLDSVRTQAAFDRWHHEFCSSFREEWQEQMKERMPYGPSRKLPDLLLKAFVRWTRLSDDRRNRLISFSHVSLDSFSLAGIRHCIDDPEIPATATMRFVAGPTMYRQIQESIRDIAKQAGVPAIYYDVLVWNIRD